MKSAGQLSVAGLTILLGLGTFGCGEREAPLSEAGPSTQNQSQSNQVESSTNSEPALGFVGLLSDGSFAKATENLSTEMKRAMSANQLKALWQQLLTGGGKYLSSEVFKRTTEEGFHCVFVLCKFQNASITLKIVLNEKDQIAGLWLQ